jgi:hypothetical protein
MPTFLHTCVAALALCGGALAFDEPDKPADKDKPAAKPAVKPTAPAPPAVLYKNLAEISGELISVSGSSSARTLTVRVPEATVTAHPHTYYGHGLGYYLKPKAIVNPKMPAQMKAQQLELKPGAVLPHGNPSVHVHVTHHDYELSFTPEAQARWHKQPKGPDGKPLPAANGPAGIGYPATLDDLQPGQIVAVHLVLPPDAKAAAPVAPKGKGAAPAAAPEGTAQPLVDRVIIMNELGAAPVPPKKK